MEDDDEDEPALGAITVPGAIRSDWRRRESRNRLPGRPLWRGRKEEGGLDVCMRMCVLTRLQRHGQKLQPRAHGRGRAIAATQQRQHLAKGRAGRRRSGTSGGMGWRSGRRARVHARRRLGCLGERRLLCGSGKGECTGERESGRIAEQESSRPPRGEQQECCDGTGSSHATKWNAL